MSEQTHIIIAGAGLAGLFTAYALTGRGVKVRVVDPLPPGSGASWAAAGMLAPCYEAVLERPEAGDPLLKACLAARTAWEEVAGPLAEEAGMEIGYDPRPSLARAAADAPAGWLDSVSEYLDELGLPYAPAGEEEMLELPLDGQVDNRAVITALVHLLEARGVDFHRGDLKGVIGGIIVDARGWQGPGASPVKGTAVSLAPHVGLPDRVVRFGNRYLAPKAGRVVLGAVSQAGISDTRVSEEDVQALLGDAAKLYPAVRETEVLERWSGVRPRAQDGLPILGWARTNRYLIGGYFRNGVLLAPLMGQWAASHILDGALPPEAIPFSPDRLSLSAT